MAFPISITGRVELPAAARGTAVILSLARVLAGRLRSVEQQDRRVKFKVGWGEYRNQSPEWVSCCDGGEIWVVSAEGRDEIRYCLRTVRVLVLVPLFLALVAFLIMQTNMTAQLVWWLGGSALLLVGNHMLGAAGVRRFVRRHALGRV